MLDPNRNLLSDLLPSGVQAEEFCYAILCFFNSGNNEPVQGEITYPNDPEYTLRLKFSVRGDEISGAFAGPKLSEEIFEKLRQFLVELFKEKSRRVGVQFFFSRRKVLGRWRYKDWFQILPVPPTAPQVEWQLAAHPFIVEVKFSSTANVFVDSIRASCEASRIELLLNTLLGPAITHISGRMIGPHGNTWVVVPHVGETTQQHIAYCQQMYLCDEVKGGTEDFSSVQGILPLPEVPASDYDAQKTRHLGDPLNIPDDLGQSLDRFFSLTSKRQKQFMNACYWLSQANYTISYSTMFLTAIQAIEVLVETPRGGSSCDKCGKALGPGRTKLFEEFLNKFAPDVSDEAGRGELYNTRSNLTHGFSPPFLIDRDVSGFSRPQVHQQSDLLGSALVCASHALRNWLWES